MRQKEHLANVEAEIVQLRTLITQQAQRIAELEAQLGKDSHNSSKLPASDGLRKRTRSQRQASGKRSGGQTEHRGQTLPRVTTPDVVETHRPAQCARCHHALDHAGGRVRETRQVHVSRPGCAAW